MQKLKNVLHNFRYFTQPLLFGNFFNNLMLKYANIYLLDDFL